MRFSKFFLLLTPILFFISACATPPKVTKIAPSAYMPTYKIEPGKLTHELGVKACILSPIGEIKKSEAPTLKLQRIYGEARVQMPTSHIGDITQKFTFEDDFNNSLMKSLEGILLQKGYNVVGTFKSWDALTHEDKKKIDFVVIPEFTLKENAKYELSCDPSCDGFEPTSLASFFSVGPGKINYSGTVQFEGSVILHIVEPITKEKLWIKQLDVKSNPQEVEVEVQYTKRQDYLAAFTMASSQFDSARKTSLIKASEFVYNKYIELSKTYLPEGEEALALAKQARELKAVKRY